MQQMDDNSLMPFGQHKNKQLANVPAVYLIYIFEKGWVRHEGVKNYILENMELLRKEAKKIYR